MMQTKSDDLHGAAPDKSHAALLLVDMGSDLDFPEAAQLLRHAVTIAHWIAAFRQRADDGILVVSAPNAPFDR